MDFGVCMKGKGQVAVEFMLLIIVMLLYLQIIIQPTLDFSAKAASDITNVAQTKLAAQTLANAVDEVYLSSSGKQTLQLFIPEAATIGCAANSITFRIIVSEDVEVSGCGVGTCSNAIATSAGISSPCGPIPSGAVTVVVEKSNGKIYVST